MSLYELKMRKSVDDSRALIDEQIVLADALSHWRIRFRVPDGGMPSPAAAALLAAIERQGNLPVDDADLAEMAADGRPTMTRAEVADMLAFARMRAADPDQVVSAAAARLSQAAAISRAEINEQDAAKAAKDDPCLEKRQALIDAMQATQAAHRAAPMHRRGLGSIIDAVTQRHLSLQGRQAVGIVTPRYPALSNALCGWRGLTLLAAMPGIGKTTLATAAMFDAVEADLDTCAVFVSFEMPTETLVDRTIAQMSGIPQRRLTLGGRDTNGRMLPLIDGRALSDREMANLDGAVARLRRLQGRVDLVGKDDIGSLQSRHGDMSRCLAPLAQRITETKAIAKASRCFVVVDHFGAIPLSAPGDSSWPNDTERARHLLSGLVRIRDMAPDDPVCVIVQSRKSDYDDPGLESIMGTADSGYAADAVIVFKDADEKANAKDKTQADTTADPMAKRRIFAKVAKGRDLTLRTVVPMALDPASSAIDEVDDGRR